MDKSEIFTPSSQAFEKADLDFLGRRFAVRLRLALSFFMTE